MCKQCEILDFGGMGGWMTQHAGDVSFNEVKRTHARTTTTTAGDTDAFDFDWSSSSSRLVWSCVRERFFLEKARARIHSFIHSFTGKSAKESPQR
jgi:hypothetical protein